MIVNKFSFVIFLTTISIVSQAQLSTIDSIKKLLKQDIPDTNRVLALAELSQSYIYFQPDSALLMAQRGLALSISISYVRGEVICLNKTANVFRTTGNMPKAFEINLQALKKAEKIKDERKIHRILNDIGNIYFMQSDYEKALEYYTKSKKIAEKIQDENCLMVSYINTGDAYMRLNLLDSSLIYTKKAYKLSMGLIDKSAIGTVLNNLGNIYSRMKQPSFAMEYYKSSITYFTTIEDNDGICEASMGMARLFEAVEQKDSCLHYAKLSMQIATKANFTQRILDAGIFLAAYYKANLSIDSAHQYLEITMEAKDRYFSQEKIKQMQSLAFDESLRQSEIEMAKSVAEKERRDNIQYAIIAILVICFLIALILLTHNIAFSEKLIRFMGVLGLLLLFEFINLYVHPYLGNVTHHSPSLMLITLVAIAALLIPLHHRIEHWVIHLLIKKNNRLKISPNKKKYPDSKEQTN